MRERQTALDEQVPVACAVGGSWRDVPGIARYGLASLGGAVDGIAIDDRVIGRKARGCRQAGDIQVAAFERKHFIELIAAAQSPGLAFGVHGDGGGQAAGGGALVADIAVDLCEAIAAQQVEALSRGIARKGGQQQRCCQN